MTRLRASALHLGLVLSIASCGADVGGEGAGGAGGASAPAPPPASDEPPAACPTPDEILARVDATNGRWLPEESDIACQPASSFTRLPFPSVQHRYLATTGDDGRREGVLAARLAEWDAMTSGYPINVSPALFGALPPYADESGRDLTFPLPPRYLEQKLRVTTAAFLREKRRGLPVLLVNFYPPSASPPPFATAADALAYWRERILPEKETEARYAAKYGFEAYMPFPNEPERVVLAMKGGVASLPAAEKVALAQAIVDETFARVRPLFDGKLATGSYAVYEPSTPGGYADGLAWKELRYRGFDAVSFALFPECSLEQTRAYVRGQLRHVAEMAARDGLTSWSIGEISVKRERYTLCGMSPEAYRALEPSLYAAIFDEAEAAVPGVQLGHLVVSKFIENPDTHALVAERWRRVR